MMFKQIKYIKQKYELKTNEKRSLRRTILGHLLEIWDTIEELDPRRMRSYGSMPHADEDALAAIVEKLLLQHENSCSFLMAFSLICICSLMALNAPAS